MWSEWLWEMIQKSVCLRLIPKAAAFSIKAAEAPVSHRIRVPLYSMKSESPCSDCRVGLQVLLADSLQQAGLLSMRILNLSIAVGEKYNANILSLRYGIHIQ